MRNSFSGFHPLVNLVYFAGVLGCGMLFMHPVLLGVSFCGALANYCLIQGKKGILFFLRAFLPAGILFAIVNPFLNHQGVTILLLINDLPFTLESICYGGAAAAMFLTVLLWFSCMNKILTSDKIIDLLGRVLPALSMLFTMALRQVPKMKEKLGQIKQAQACIGQGPKQGTLWQRLRRSLTIFSILMTWALENGVDTADSMKARGYGLSRRTRYSNYRFSRRDGLVLSVILVLLCGILLAGLGGSSRASYFPAMHFAPVTGWSFLLFGAYGLLCFLPVVLQGEEALQWKHSQSKI